MGALLSDTGGQRSGARNCNTGTKAGILQVKNAAVARLALPEIPLACFSFLRLASDALSLDDVPAKTPKEGQVAAKRLMGKQKYPQGGQDCKCRAITSFA